MSTIDSNGFERDQSGKLVGFAPDRAVPITAGEGGAGWFMMPILCLIVPVALTGMGFEYLQSHVSVFLRVPLAVALTLLIVLKVLPACIPALLRAYADDHGLLRALLCLILGVFLVGGALDAQNIARVFFTYLAIGVIVFVCTAILMLFRSLVKALPTLAVIAVVVILYLTYAQRFITIPGHHAR